MLESRAFNSRAKDWMRATNEIDLRDTVVAYREMLDDFDSWFGPAYAAFHLDACESFLQALDTARAAVHRAQMEAVKKAWEKHANG
jgi:hypothetical protein